jgi:hypothetical protein
MVRRIGTPLGTQKDPHKTLSKRRRPWENRQAWFQGRIDSDPEKAAQTAWDWARAVQVSLEKSGHHTEAEAYKRELVRVLTGMAVKADKKMEQDLQRYRKDQRNVKDGKFHPLHPGTGDTPGMDGGTQVWLKDPFRRMK